MTAQTTAARQAVWSVIDNWSELNPAGVSLFKRKITHDDDVGLLMNSIQPGIRDMLAVEVLPARTTPAWLVHRLQEAQYMITIQLAGLRLTKMEEAVEALIRGLYQAADPDTPNRSYIKVATGYHPQSHDIAWQKTSVGDNAKKTKCWLATISLGLKFNLDPFGNAP